MAEVNIEIMGRKYRMACEDGQESQLIRLGERLDSFVGSFREEFGEIGDNRLTIMAGIAVVDALEEAEEKIEKLQAELEMLTTQEEKLNNAYLQLKNDFAKQMTNIAKRIEQAASALEKNSNSE